MKTTIKGLIALLMLSVPDARRNPTRARAPLIVLSPVQFSQLIGTGNLAGTRLVVGVLDAENVDLILVAP